MGNDIMVALEIYGIGFVIAAVIAGLIRGMTVMLQKHAKSSK